MLDIYSTATLVLSLLGISTITTGILYLALTSRLDDRYMKEKSCNQKEKTTNVMIKSIKDDIADLKAINKTIFEKIDTLSEHMMEIIKGMNA